MDYLDFVEEYRADQKITQFDKVMVLVKRVKDIYEGKMSQAAQKVPQLKALSLAHYEYNHEFIAPLIRKTSEDDELLENYNFDED